MPQFTLSSRYNYKMTNRPRKRFAQHWLKSPAILQEIIAAANLSPDDAVLEIGPGTGILTRELLNLVSAVVAVEIDRDLCKRLTQQFGKTQNFCLIEADILSLKLEDYYQAFPPAKNLNKVVANIPYNITGPILEKLLGTISEPAINDYKSIVLLIQKEVAERLVAEPQTKAFNALSVRIQYLADCELICTVPAKAFSPPPKVDSAVVRLTPRPFPVIPNNPHHLDIILKLAFANRRKMLHNNLKSVIETEKLKELLQQLNINPQARAEELSLINWINLSNRLQTS